MTLVSKIPSDALHVARVVNDLGGEFPLTRWRVQFVVVRPGRKLAEVKRAERSARTYLARHPRDARERVRWLLEQAVADGVIGDYRVWNPTRISRARRSTYCTTPIAPGTAGFEELTADERWEQAERAARAEDATHVESSAPAQNVVAQSE